MTRGGTRRALDRRLVGGALDGIRLRGLSVVALCPLVRVDLRRHPEYADLVVRDRTTTR